jgi:phosphoribosylformylglycinamidine cyclo-ligase
MNDENKYEELGVSHSKEDVHRAIKDLDKGLFPNAFCTILPDINNDPQYCCVFHSDSAGTKSILAYMMYKETGNLDFFRGIVQDAIVMNVDDVLCVGVDGSSLITNTIGRNKKIISGDIISVLINEHDIFTKKLTEMGFDVSLAGGETEDIGDLVQTVAVGCSLFSRIKRNKIITTENIQENDIIIGLASFGQSKYEDKFNSGIGSNGLTLARHGTLSNKYYKKYPECVNQFLDQSSAFFGSHDLHEKLEGTPLTLGEALLSPTRTFAPIMIQVFDKFRKDIHAIFHNTGGGQTKCLNFGKNIRYIKDNLFETPKIFELIHNSSKTTWKEMYQVFNMGHRMEMIVPEGVSSEIIRISESFGVRAQKIGYIEKNNGEGKNNELVISSENGKFTYKTHNF